jgi:hypothetical protein
MTTLTAAHGPDPTEQAEHLAPGFTGYTKEALEKMGTNRGGSATKTSIKKLGAVVTWVRDHVTDLAALTLTGSARVRLNTTTSFDSDQPGGSDRYPKHTGRALRS